MNRPLAPADFPRTTRAAEGLPRWRWTTAELERMVQLGVLDEDEKIELFGGEIVPISPKGRLHEQLAEALIRRWTRFAPEAIAISVERQFDLDASTYTDPDIIVRPADVITYDLKPSEALLIVEIADLSWDKDTETKARLYAQHGVREYWVINARTRETRIHLRPDVDRYADLKDFAPDAMLTPHLAPDLAVRLADLKAG